jgi:hypothetical protein
MQWICTTGILLLLTPPNLWAKVKKMTCRRKGIFEQKQWCITTAYTGVRDEPHRQKIYLPIKCDITYYISTVTARKHVKDNNNLKKKNLHIKSDSYFSYFLTPSLPTSRLSLKYLFAGNCSIGLTSFFVLREKSSWFMAVYFGKYLCIIFCLTWYRNSIIWREC